MVLTSNLIFSLWLEWNWILTRVQWDHTYVQKLSVLFLFRKIMVSPMGNFNLKKKVMVLNLNFFSTLGGRRWYNRWRMGISRNHRSWWCGDIWPIVLFVIAVDMGNIKSELIFMVFICAIVKGLPFKTFPDNKKLKYS